MMISMNTQEFITMKTQNSTSPIMLSVITLRSNTIMLVIDTSLKTHIVLLVR